ncbi:restriction endonuclease subunit S [Brevundimonas diminuta]|uniref:restriction endonuclease subunit S n=1 Tax=Brevundimonas diminuta TaxID=293 RepID=UPI001F5AC6BA|nr:restriction endonuclease subunit S [Brevundimonas diminuta]
MSGETPEGWRVAKLGEIAVLSGGTTPPKSNNAYWMQGDVPWATPSDITSLPLGQARIAATEAHVAELALKECSLKLNPTGTVLMTSRATIGFAVINDVPMATNQGFLNFTCFDDCDPRFLCHWLNANRGLLTAAAGGSTFKELSRGTAKLLPISLPTLDEQRKIAEVLRSADDAIAAASEAARQAARTFDSVIASVLGPYAAASGAPNAETAPLADFCQRVTYGFTNPMPTTDNGPWMVTALNVKNGKIDYATARHTSASAYDALTEKSRPPIGAVLVTKDGTLGRVAVVDQPDVCVNQSVAVLEPRKGVLNPLFLSYLLQSEIGQTRMLADSGGGSVKHIYITKLGAMPVSVPSFAEQTKIADQVAKCSAAVELAEQSLRQLRQLRISTADDLLTGRVRVPA